MSIIAIGYVTTIKHTPPHTGARMMGEVDQATVGEAASVYEPN